jgi:hypothetical protein
MPRSVFLYTEYSRLHQHLGKEAPMRRGGPYGIVGLIILIIVVVLLLRVLGII